MINFMFGVLGSIGFWVLFFVVGFFAGTVVFKRIAPKMYNFVLGRSRSFNDRWMNGDSWVILIFVIILIYFFWPIIIAALLIGFIIKHLFKTILWKSFQKAVNSVDSIIPTIKFEKRGGDKE